MFLPQVLGPLFDSWGRKQMIAGAHLVSGVLLALSAVMFDAGVLNATTQTIMWVVIFFFASAGASAAGKSLEQVIKPLTSVDEKAATPTGPTAA